MIDQMGPAAMNNWPVPARRNATVGPQSRGGRIVWQGVAHQ
jgi:hypothetical protein